MMVITFLFFIKMFVRDSLFGGVVIFEGTGMFMD